MAACHHDHGHSHDAAHGARLGAAMSLAAIFLVAEAVGGWWSGSLALLADAGHMLADVAALGLSWFAAWIVRRRGSTQQTFGYARAEILAALINGAALVAVAVMVVREAWGRLAAPQLIHTEVMLAVAVGGLIVNGIQIWLLHGGRHANLNLRGAWLHVVGDALGSIGVIVAGVCVWQWGWAWADPAASIAISLLIILASWRLLREAVDVLMENAPASVDVERVRLHLTGADGVREVHCLHVWRIHSGLDSLSAHVVIDEGRSAAEVLPRLTSGLRTAFPVDHITLQVEPMNYDGCRDRGPETCRGPSTA